MSFKEQLKERVIRLRNAAKGWIYPEDPYDRGKDVGYCTALDRVLSVINEIEEKPALDLEGETEQVNSLLERLHGAQKRTLHLYPSEQAQREAFIPGYVILTKNEYEELTAKAENHEVDWSQKDYDMLRAIRLILIASEDDQKDFYYAHKLTRKQCTDWLEELRKLNLNKQRPLFTKEMLSALREVIDTRGDVANGDRKWVFPELDDLYEEIRKIVGNE